MATYPLAFPSTAPASESLRLERAQAVMQSPHTFAQQTVNNSDRWLLEFTWPRVSHAVADRIQGWLDSLKGQLGSFTYQPRGSKASTLTGRTLAAAAFPYSDTVLIGGWAANAASTLYIGQYLQIGTRLHRITSAPANANASGQCLVEVAPQVRTQYASGTAVEFVAPKGIFRLTSSDGEGYTLDPDRTPSFPRIMAKEAL